MTEDKEEGYDRCDSCSYPLNEDTRSEKYDDLCVLCATKEEYDTV